ncbi:MAG: hypothetical protein HOL66_08015 [Rhodospirillaceae bacterium]|jgi:hypothetical protein|nr:hypothetical protein [Rhodospirillaceae bacterium]MBT5244176.1 hypothetical protein [Rhodospirillaceae bacterium]MBT5561701.1 hypothetical protein [Rhodospirillaceae bacterium]MBT6243140.1 hypothetical protein [Rhodospirillaceae bacterium]MBT7137467.1 hypothetical protein [Rhodospirillaceae bacterium]
MNQLDGLSHDGLKTALGIKGKYQDHEPICLPGEKTRILTPENLMNHHVDLMTLEDPLALSMIATRDPEAPMALAAAARLSPLGVKSKLLSGVFQVVGETTKHPLIAKCVSLITENAFDPEAIVMVRKHASQFIVNSRQEYTLALRRNMQALLEGTIAPRYFVSEFFELTEAGNMRSDIRKKLVLSLLVSDSIRPSIKFLFLENFDRLPNPVKKAILSEVLKAEPSHHMEIIKEELRWMASKEERSARKVKPEPVTPLAPSTENKVDVSPESNAAEPKTRPWRPGESPTPSGSMEIPWN